MAGQPASLDEVMSSLISVAGEHYVAAELARRGFLVSLTRGNAPGVDLLAHWPETKKSIAIQVKTADGAKQKRGHWIMSKKDEDVRSLRSNFFIFVRLPHPAGTPEYFIVPARAVAVFIKKDHKLWLSAPGAKGQQRSIQNSMRTFKDPAGKWRDRWELLTSKVR